MGTLFVIQPRAERGDFIMLDKEEYIATKVTPALSVFVPASHCFSVDTQTRITAFVAKYQTYQILRTC